MKDLYNNIFIRKSTRHYDMSALPNETLDEIKDFANNLKPLFEDIKVEYKIAHEVKNIMPVKAPYYFIISSENKSGYLTNIGFMFQQMDLFLSSKGLGTCWLGMARPGEKVDTRLEFVIILAFGRAADTPYRKLSEFNRKPLSEISSGNDTRLECARLAPSASNTQNWFFVCENGMIHLYQAKLHPLKKLVYDKMNKIDMGIALCHLYVASEHEGKTIEFLIFENQKELSGYTYVGTIK